MTLMLPSGFALVDADPQFGGLPALRVRTPLTELVVLPHGAHVCHWAPTGLEDVLWMSEASEFAAGRPVRGGVPICFPWFGPGLDGEHAPAHGWARLVDWRLVEAALDAEGNAVIAFELTGADVADQPGVDELAPDFTVRYTIRAGASLELALSVTAGEQPLEFQEALHTYLRVRDIQQVFIEGLDGATYLDKVAGGFHQQVGDITFAGETDRVHESTQEVIVHDGERRVVVAKDNAANTVVWNPWIDKAAAMADFGDDEWRGMVCVEAANALTTVSVPAGQTHTLTARHSVQ